MYHDFLLLMGLALVLGFKYSYDADHLVAVSNLIARSDNLRRTRTWRRGPAGGRRSPLRGRRTGGEDVGQACEQCELRAASGKEPVVSDPSVADEDEYNRRMGQRREGWLQKQNARRRGIREGSRIG